MPVRRTDMTSDGGGGAATAASLALGQDRASSAFTAYVRPSCAPDSERAGRGSAGSSGQQGGASGSGGSASPPDQQFGGAQQPDPSPGRGPGSALAAAPGGDAGASGSVASVKEEADGRGSSDDEAVAGGKSGALPQDTRSSEEPSGSSMAGQQGAGSMTQVQQHLLQLISSQQQAGPGGLALSAQQQLQQMLQGALAEQVQQAVQQLAQQAAQQQLQQLANQQAQVLHQQQQQAQAQQQAQLLQLQGQAQAGAAAQHTAAAAASNPYADIVGGMADAANDADADEDASDSMDEANAESETTSGGACPAAFCVRGTEPNDARPSLALQEMHHPKHPLPPVCGTASTSSSRAGVPVSRRPPAGAFFGRSPLPPLADAACRSRARRRLCR